MGGDAVAYTQAQHDALEAAIATGATSVTHDGETVQFRSSKDMQALLGRMKRELGLTSGTRRKLHVVGFR